MRIRESVVAGQFYPADPTACRDALTKLLASQPEFPDVPENIVGCLVPHAGWMYSGGVTARVFRALAQNSSADVVILFGGVHRHRGKVAAMFGAGRWITPLGSIDINARLAERILGHTNLIVDDPFAHEDEHSIEVQVPFVQHFFPSATIVPIMVPSVANAHEVGDAVGRTLTAYKYNALIVGTTDLTHYGPRYGFTPHGIGNKGHVWAKSENDRRFIDMVLEGQCQTLVREAAEHKNACSAGAAAATIAAVKHLKAERGVLLQHSSSSEVMASMGQMDASDSVGYAGIVFAGQ